MTTRRKAAAAAAAMPEAAADEVYVIESILDVRKSRGSREFLVKWWNYGPEWNTWEPGIINSSEHAMPAPF